MHASLQIPCDLGADGIVMWGSTAQMKNDSYWSWLEKDAGPYTKSFECKGAFSDGGSSCVIENNLRSKRGIYKK